MTAVTDLSLRLPGDPGGSYGRFEVTQDGPRLVVDRADPLVLVSRELVVRSLREGIHPDVEIRPCRIAVNAANGRWVYRLGRFMAFLDCYEAQFPTEEV
jgi:hypothetical protein